MKGLVIVKFSYLFVLLPLVVLLTYLILLSRFLRGKRIIAFKMTWARAVVHFSHPDSFLDGIVGVSMIPVYLVLFGIIVYALVQTRLS